MASSKDAPKPFLFARYKPEAGIANGLEDERGQKGRGKKGSSPAYDLAEKYSGGRGKAPKKLTNVDSRVVQNTRHAVRPGSPFYLPSMR